MKKFLIVCAVAAGVWSVRAVTVPEEWQQARTLKGAWGARSSDDVAGYCVLKCGKANKKRQARVSLSIKKFNGKFINMGSVSVKIAPDASVVEVVWTKKNYAVTIQKDGSFFGHPLNDASPNGAELVWNASVGGVLEGDHYLELPDWYRGYQSNAMPDGTGGTEHDLVFSMGLWEKLGRGLCTGEDANYAYHPFTVKFKKWSFWTTRPLYWFPGSFTDANVAKVSYKDSTGLFHGQLKVVMGPYCMDGDTKKRTLPLKIKGGCIDGRFYGEATYRSFLTRVRGQ